MTITIFAASTRAIGFIFRIFLSRVMGPEMLGLYQVAMSIFMVMLTIISSGLPLVISREIAKKDKDPHVVFNITTAGLIIGSIASLILCLIVLLFQGLLGFIFTDQRAIAILIALLPAVIASSIYCVLRAIWWGQKKFFLLGLTELIEQIARVITFVLLLGFIFYFTDLAQLSAWSFSIACIISAIIVIILFIKTNKLTKTKKGEHKAYIKPLLRSAIPITGVRLLASVAFPLVSILLPIRLMAAGWTSIEAISHFGIMIGMTFPLLTIPMTLISSLAVALIPELSQIVAKKDWSKARRQIQTSINFTVFINFIFIPIYIALGEGLGLFLYDNAASGAYLARSAWVMIPFCLSQITSASLNSLNEEASAMKNYIIGSIILFTCVWFLPAVVGVDSVIIGLGASTTITSILNIWVIRNKTMFSNADQTLPIIFQYIFISIPCLAIGFFTYNLTALLPLFLTLSISGILCCGSFLGLSWAFNLFTVPKK